VEEAGVGTAVHTAKKNVGELREASEKADATIAQSSEGGSRYFRRTGIGPPMMAAAVSGVGSAELMAGQIGYREGDRRKLFE
jgi:hypothetical protein